METEMIDKLYLELSQVTNAKTEREIELEIKIINLNNEIFDLKAENKEQKQTLEEFGLGITGL